MSQVVLTEGDLSVRRLRDVDEDYALLARWREADHVKPYWDVDDPPLSIATARAWYGPHSDEAGYVTFCIIELAGRPVGFCQFYRWADEADGARDTGIPFDADTFGIDIMVGEPDLIGSGTGSRTVDALCRFLFDERGASWIALNTALDNLGAQRAYERAGFRKVRHTLDTDTRDGRRVECWLMIRHRDPSVDVATL